MSHETPSGAQFSYVGRPVQTIAPWRDLPSESAPASFQISYPDGETRRFTVSRRDRQTLEALMQGPFGCAASPRIAPSVADLRDIWVNIESRRLPTREDGVDGWLPINVLRADVARIEGADA